MHTFENVEAAAAKAAAAQATVEQAMDAQSPDHLRLIAYGRKVQELLSQSDAATWIDHLWDMYTGLAHFTRDVGYDPEVHKKFVSFKKLVFFFQEVGKLEGSGRPA